MPIVTEFMQQLYKELKDKNELADSSANLYVNNLFRLNDSVGFKSLTFLKNTDKIIDQIKDYALNTQRTKLASIVNALSLYKDKAAYKKLYQYYNDLYNDKNELSKNKKDTSEKTDREKENWIDWKDVEAKRDNLKTEVDQFPSKNFTIKQFNTLLQYLVLSLYSLVPPRRNQDYLQMYVVKKHTDDADTNRNYYDMDSNKFIFNQYKTKKTYHQQDVDVPTELKDVLELFIAHHPLNLSKKATDFKLLVSSDGSPITTFNAITRILNKIFGKKVGSTMLRHSYLTTKYGDQIDEQRKDATQMGHSLGTQKDYIKSND